MGHEQMISTRYCYNREGDFVGAVGKVSIGCDTLLQRNVVIKMVRDKESALREATVMAKYGSSRFLPQIYDYYTDKMGGNIVMEYIDGKDLGHHIQGHARTQDSAVHITMNILRGLRHLHSKDVIHGDIQPRNILIHENIADSLKIIDFGTAVLKNPDGHWVGTPFGGTWEYMPPEQFERPAVLDNRSDLYAAAGVCIYLLTGKAPCIPEGTGCGGSNTVDEYKSACHRLHKDGLFCPLPENKLTDILQKALHPDKTKRFQSAQEFISALRPFSH